MKKYFYLFLMLTGIAFGQEKKNSYDYFVQFNTQQFAKKANIDSLFSHMAFKGLNKENSKTKLNDFMSFIDKSKPVIMHGNFTDSIPYYQISLPLIDDKGLQQFVQHKMEEANAKDSVVETIKAYAKYQVYSPKNDNFTLAWDKNNLVIYGVLEPSINHHYPVDTTEIKAEAVDTAVVEEVYDAAADAAIVEPVAPVEEVVKVAGPGDSESEEEESEESYDDEYYRKLEEENEKERLAERREKQARQEAQLAVLFEEGFVMPASDKINAKADISAWMNYHSVSSVMNSYRYLYRFMSSAKPYETDHTVKGMTADFYFENDKARVEQTVEYSEPLAKIVSKMVSGKPNKNTFRYFPVEKPLAYMSYHMNTEEALKNYPKLAEQFLATMPLEKQDVGIITDLFTTLIDEEATASIFDGDLSMFLHTVEPYTEKVITTSYDDNYEEVTEEKMVTKSRPVFSFVMTSTHPTMTDKLLDLGIRKQVLVKENNYYVIKKASADYGSIVLLKDGDVFVVTNGLKYLANGSKSDFAAEVKKEMTKNYMAGNLNIIDFIKRLMAAEGTTKNVEKITKISNQFKNLQFKSSKKMKDNKMKLEIEFNSNFDNKNIIMQSLDLFSYLN